MPTVTAIETLVNVSGMKLAGIIVKDVGLKTGNNNNTVQPALRGSVNPIRNEINKPIIVRKNSVI